MHHAQYIKELCALGLIETRSTGTRRSLLRGRGAHPATACASPSPRRRIRRLRRRLTGWRITRNAWRLSSDWLRIGHRRL